MKTKSKLSINKLITRLDLPITARIYLRKLPLSLPSPKPTKSKRPATDEIRKEATMLKFRLSVTDPNPLPKSRLTRDLAANILSLSVIPSHPSKAQGGGE